MSRGETRLNENGNTKIQGARYAERLFSAAEVADNLGVCKMTVLRYIENGRLPRPSFYLRQPNAQIWLWNAGEFRRVVKLFRGDK